MEEKQLLCEEGAKLCRRLASLILLPCAIAGRCDPSSAGSRSTQGPPVRCQSLLQQPPRLALSIQLVGFKAVFCSRAERQLWSNSEVFQRAMMLRSWWVPRMEFAERRVPSTGENPTRTEG